MYSLRERDKHFNLRVYSLRERDKHFNLRAYSLRERDKHFIRICYGTQHTYTMTTCMVVITCNESVKLGKYLA